MEKLEVGISVGQAEGVAFFGVDEVNQRIAEGARVVALEPIGVLVKKVGEDEENAHVVLSGCRMTVVLETPEED